MEKCWNRFCRHPYLTVTLLYAVYTVWFFALEKLDHRPVMILHAWLDDLIPFEPAWVCFYVLWFPFLAFPILWLLKHHGITDVWHLIWPLFTAMYGALVIYILWPNGLNLRPAEIPGKDIFSAAVRWIEAADDPNHVCPSIHVSTTLIIDLSLVRSKTVQNTRVYQYRFLIHLLSLCICVSTVFIKQHSVIDVAAGLAFGFGIDLMYQSIFRKSEA